MLCMYDEVVTRMRIIEGKTKAFSFTRGLFEGSKLSPYLFALGITNELIYIKR